MYILDLCKDLEPIIAFIKYGVIPVVQIGIPIIVILLGMLDLGKMVVSGKEEDIKKQQGILVKRVVFAIAIFFVITIVHLVFNLLANTQVGTDKPMNNWFYCWKAIENPKLKDNNE